MKTVFAVLFVGAYGYAQTCPVPAPVAVPVPDRVVVILPPDGGVTRLSDGGTTAGCAVFATGTTGSNPNPNIYALTGAAKCATAAAIGQQAFANDNGWADGGVP